jgi:hypothetical protein
MESHQKEFFKLKCFYSLKILTSPFLLRDYWSFPLFFSSLLFFMLRLLRIWGFDDI